MEAKKTGNYSHLMSQQESGKRASKALPYVLSTSGYLVDSAFQINMKADNQLFGKQAVGSPFTVYAPGSYKSVDNQVESYKNWSFAVKAGDRISYEWPLSSFQQENYELHLYGPNGFYREFAGSKSDPKLRILVSPELKKLTKVPTGKLLIELENVGIEPINLKIEDLSYKKGELAQLKLKGNSKAQQLLDVEKSFNWYDLKITAVNFPSFYQRFAGKLEIGKDSFTDPLINREA